MSQEEYEQELRIYAYTTTTGQTGTIAAYSALDAKVRVARRAIVALPMEVEIVQTRVCEVERINHHAITKTRIASERTRGTD
jgi:hypothetical protein